MKAIAIIALNNLHNSLKNFALWAFLIIFPIAELAVFNTVFSTPMLPEVVNTTIKLTQLNIVNNNFNISSMAIIVLGQFLMICSIVASSFFISERENRTLMRTLTLPVTKLQIYLGFLLSLLLQLTIVCCSIIIISGIMFNVHWANNYFDLFLVGSICLFLASSLGFFVSFLFKNSSLAGGLMSGIVILMSFLNGDMTNGKLIFKNSDYLSINKWITASFRGLSNGHSLHQIYPNLLVLIILGIIFTICTIALFRKENIYE